MNERGRRISERLAWALDLGIAPAPGSPGAQEHRSAAEAGADRAQWAADGFSHLRQLRDAMHGALSPDSLPESPVERWLAEGHYFESLAISHEGRPPIPAWLDEHPNAAQELVRGLASDGQHLRRR